MQFSHVFLQVKIATESFATQATCERLCFIVGVHVEREIVDLVKRLATNVTFVLFLIAVGELVVLVVSFLVEALIAVFAHIRFVAQVYTHVRVQCRAPET